MKQGRLKAHLTMLRVARVKEIRASSALAQATNEQRQSQALHDDACAKHQAVLSARQSIHSSALDMGRYALLSSLDELLGQRRWKSDEALTASKATTCECAATWGTAQRHSTNAEEKAISERLELLGASADRQRDDAMDLWLMGRSR